ncbi:MAG: hypothetical protein JNK95_15735 [Candidatus Competibacter sp.]|nr:hypothetical protein [Candidatus Competibacter sp.]MDG4606158.1 hypothetical protein [Candidatus Contendobacter sp.]HUN10606.1 hypothetical protein [Aggregatilineales bacterium]
MNEKATQPRTSLDSAVAALRRHMMEKGNRFEHGPAYEGDGKVLSSVKQTVRMYEGMGYVKLFELGNPPAYAVLQRGHRELHIFQPRDPKIKQWLADEGANLNDPAIRAYLLQKSGLSENDLAIAAKPQRYHINEVDDVFIVTADGD